MLVGVAGSILGLITIFAGRMLLKYVVFASTVICVVCVSNAACYIIYDGTNLDDSVYWSVLIVFTILGFLLACVLRLKKNLGRGLLALWLGFEVGTAISTMFFFGHSNAAVFLIIITFFMLFRSTHCSTLL